MSTILIMKKTILIFDLFLIVFISVGQNKLCELPSIAYQELDTSISKNSKLNYSSKNFQLDYEIEKENPRLLIATIKSTSTFIFFYDDNSISTIIHFDSCFYKETHFKTNIVTSEFECDYSVSNHCFEKFYVDNTLSYEDIWVPFQFSGIKDTELLNYSCQDKKAVLTKTIVYYGNEKDEKSIDINSLYK